MLVRTSKRPVLVHTSSLAAVVPAPTRTLYGSSKAAALMLYQSLAIEHPQVKFCFLLPSTVASEFRKSAVDGQSGHPREAGHGRGAKVEVVARICLAAADNERRLTFIPSIMSVAPWLYVIFPGLIERLASRKYGYIA